MDVSLCRNKLHKWWPGFSGEEADVPRIKHQARRRSAQFRRLCEDRQQQLGFNPKGAKLCEDHPKQLGFNWIESIERVLELRFDHILEKSWDAWQSWKLKLSLFNACVVDYCRKRILEIPHAIYWSTTTIMNVLRHVVLLGGRLFPLIGSGSEIKGHHGGQSMDYAMLGRGWELLEICGDQIKE